MVYIRAIESLIQSSPSALDTLVLFNLATFRRSPTVTSIRREQIALDALTNVLQSLGDMENHKRWSRVQPPEAFGREGVKQHEANETPQRMINNLEVILVIDLGNL